MSPYNLKTSILHFFVVTLDFLLIITGDLGQVFAENGCLRINSDTSAEFKFIAHDTACFFSEVIKKEPVLKKMAFESLLESIQRGDEGVTEVERKFRTGADSKFIVKVASSSGTNLTTHGFRYYTVILYKSGIQGDPKAFVKEGGYCPASLAPAQKHRQPAMDCVDLQTAKERLETHFEVEKQNFPLPIPPLQKKVPVFNNKVFTVIADSIDQFIKEAYGLKEKLPELLNKIPAEEKKVAEYLIKDYMMPIKDAIKMAEIQNTTVDFEEGERKFPDVNSFLYELFVKALTTKTVECLKILTQNPAGSSQVPCRETVGTIAWIMNDGNLYIDEEARDKYIEESKYEDVTKKVESSKRVVIRMLGILSEITTLGNWADGVEKLAKVVTQRKS